MKITIRDVGKDYGPVRALDAVDLDVASGELLALVTLGLKSLLEWRHGDELAALRGR